MCMPFWPVGAAGGPFWHGGNGACLFGRVVQQVGLFGTEARVCMPFWPGGASGGSFWYEGRGVCVCLFGRVVQLVGLFGTKARACACAITALQPCSH